MFLEEGIITHLVLALIFFFEIMSKVLGKEISDVRITCLILKL